MQKTPRKHKPKFRPSHGQDSGVTSLSTATTESPALEEQSDGSPESPFTEIDPANLGPQISRMVATEVAKAIASLRTEAQDSLSGSHPRGRRAVASRPRTEANSPPGSDSETLEDGEFIENPDEDHGPRCYGPDGQRYPLKHAVEFLADLPPSQFGLRFQGLAKPLQRVGLALQDALATSSVAPDTACVIAESLVHIAGFAQHLSESPSASDQELAFFAQLLDSRRARLPIASAVSRLGKLARTATPKSAASPKAKVPSSKCPSCGEFGHWRRDCPRRNAQPLSAVSSTPNV